MRIVKRCIGEMMPGTRVFLDVDDLKKGKGADLVDGSRIFLLFCTCQFWSSPNCIRELLRGVLRKKTFIMLMEPDPKRGRCTRAQVRELLRHLEADGKYADAKWAGGLSLEDEMKSWGGHMPTADELEEMLFEFEPIPWDVRPPHSKLLPREPMTSACISSLLLPVCL